MSTTVDNGPGLGVAAGVAGEAAARPAPGGACPNCDGPEPGRFCPDCGEKRIEGADLTLKRFAAEALQEVTSVEHSKIFRTLRLLLFRPGRLTLEYFAGRRGRYVKPLNLCLVVFALTIFAFSVYRPISTLDFGRMLEMTRPMLGEAESDRARQAYERIAARRNLTFEVLAERISEKWQKYMSLSQIAIVFLFALLLQLVFITSGRYFVEHLVFSMHYLTFAFLSTALLWPAYLLIGLEPSVTSYVFGALKWVLDTAYLFLALKAFYGLGTAKGLLVSLPLFAGYFGFYMTLYTVTLLVAIVVAAKY